MITGDLKNPYVPTPAKKGKKKPGKEGAADANYDHNYVRWNQVRIV